LTSTLQEQQPQQLQADPVTPAQLAANDFDAYPPLAKQVALNQLDLFHEMPLPFIALLLRELIQWDWKFPAERKQLDGQFVYLRSMSLQERKNLFLPFANLKLSPQLERADWVNEPASFSEQLSAHLWASHQIDSFRAAAVDFFFKFNAAVPEQPPGMRRLVIVVIGQGVHQNTYPLFRKLRQHGTYFQRVSAPNGVETLIEAVNARAKADTEPFAHWYIDGSALEKADNRVTCVSYDALTPVRARLQAKMRQVFESGTGPEAFRSLLARMAPRDLGMDGTANPVLTRFELSLLTEGSGTQVFSTTFVQWAAREALRRAQPVTLLARFTPRQQERPMNALLMEAASKPALDPQGSLIDADMGAYYTWLNQQRLTGTAQATFLAWFESGTEAMAIGPNFDRGSRSDAISLETILNTLI
jgi:hypothetical protein